MPFDGSPHAYPAYSATTDYYPGARGTGGALSAALRSAYWTARNKSRVIWQQPFGYQGTNFAVNSDGAAEVYAVAAVPISTVEKYIPDEVTHLCASMSFTWATLEDTTINLKLTATDAVAATANATGTVAVGAQIGYEQEATPLIATTLRSFAPLRRNSRELTVELDVKSLASAALWTMQVDTWGTLLSGVFTNPVVIPHFVSVWWEVREAT